ncbi:hypothetical protein BT69DRAFT_1039547 [Atractiella rhizophila]|nr:hypothetical protein BT69DRAFT_1039547 [Atractiella rhizophila]
MSQRRKASGLGNGPLERVPSVELPTPMPMMQKQAATSLWQNCLNVRNRLQRVPGFAEHFLIDALDDPEVANSIVPNDPVAHVCACLRRGSSLCFLFNALGLPKILEVNPAATRNNPKVCKQGAAHFIMACQKELGWGGNDLFTITELYDQDTNGTVKVIHAVSMLLQELERRNVLMEPEHSGEHEQEDKPKGKRAQIVNELLNTEREYVRDLEKLQDYQRQLAQQNILTQDTIHNLFMNLNLLVDFQRRFLNGAEYQSSLPPSEQRFGQLFLAMEDGFACYEPFCANFTAAQDLAMAENMSLMKLAHVIEPNYGLPALLIKPVQRICKYPLLLKDLHSATDESYPYRNELSQGLECIKRVTDKVNETKRQKENELAVQELVRRVDDWKGHQVSTFGNLLLEDTFMVLKGMTEREYHVYLFERIVLCCKEAGVPPNKKSSKSNSILKKPPARKRTILQMKGRIFVNNILAAETVTKNGTYCLQVTWRGDLAEEDFTLKCRSDEILRQWQKAMRKAMDDASRYRRGHLSNGPKVSSPLSQFPNTPASEFGPNASGNSFDDEDGETVYDYEPSNGRSTPSVRRLDGTRSLPPDPRDPFNLRPRAKTEDSTSAAMIQNWRNQTPNNYPSMPSLPRVPTASDISSQHSLRSSASSRNLKSKASMEWSSARTDDSTSTRPTISRQTSQASLLQHHPNMPSPSHAQQQPHHRSRSASSPNMYQPEPTDVPSVPPLNHHYANGAFSHKRESSSSGDTDPSSSRDSGGSGNVTAPSSTSTGPPLLRNVSKANGNAIKVKVNFGEDTFVIVVLANVTFHQLVDKVFKKISICGDRTRIDPSSLRLRYQDEEGDKITLMSDDDVAMAFDM